LERGEELLARKPLRPHELDIDARPRLDREADIRVTRWHQLHVWRLDDDFVIALAPVEAHQVVDAVLQPLPLEHLTTGEPELDEQVRRGEERLSGEDDTGDARRPTLLKIDGDVYAAGLGILPHLHVDAHRAITALLIALLNRLLEVGHR